MVDNAPESQQQTMMGEYPRGAAQPDAQQGAQQAPVPAQQMQVPHPQQAVPMQMPVNMQMQPGAHMPPQAEAGTMPADQVNFNIYQQQQMYMMQHGYMYPSGSQPGFNQYQNQWNQYQQYQQYQQHLYTQQQQQQQQKQPQFQQQQQQPPATRDTPPPSTAAPAAAAPPPSKEGGGTQKAPVEKKNAWGTAPAKPKHKPAREDSAEASMQKMSLNEETSASNDGQKNGESEGSGGPKSWADIARDKNSVEAAAVETGAESTENSGGERAQQQGYRSSRGGFRNRGGKHHTQGNRPRLAGRRGLTLQELQGQVQQLVMVQRLVASANQMRVDPSFLYHTQMSQYAVYHYGSYVPMSYTTPGSVALDDNSYPFLQLLSLYPHLVGINQTSVVQNPAHARYFVLTCANEQEAHAGIKYSHWEFPEKYASVLNQALGEVSGLGPVYCFVTVPSLKRCVGLAEMISPASPKEVVNGEGEPTEGQNGAVKDETESAEKQEKASTSRVQLRWICVKDTHLGLYRRASMLEDKNQASVQAPAEQGSSTTMEDQPQDAPQEKEREKDKVKEKHPVYALESSQGLQALQVMLEQPVVSTILLDFKMFDDAETSGSMPSFYRADFYLPGYSYNSRGRSGYSRGGGRGGRGSYSSRNRGGFHSGNNSFRGGYRRGRGSGRGRGGYRNQDDGTRYGGNRQNQDSNASSTHERSHYRERPRRLVTGDGAEVSLDGKYQFEVQRKVKKGKKGKKEATGEEAKSTEVEAEAGAEAEVEVEVEAGAGAEAGAEE